MNKAEIRQQLKKALDDLSIPYYEGVVDIRIILPSERYMININSAKYPIGIVDTTYFSKTPNGNWNMLCNTGDDFTNFHNLLARILNDWYCEEDMILDK